MGLIPAWSYSTKKNYETCPYMLKHRFVFKTKKKAQPEDSPLKRGLALHKEAENFIKQDGALPAEFKGLEEYFHRLKSDAYESGYEAEEPLGFDKDWKQTGWYDKDVWLRVSFDLQIGVTGESTHLIDYKTGKKDGNELSHLLQGQLYAVAAVQRNPKLKSVLVDFAYLDHDKVTSKLWVPKLLRKKKETWNDVGIKITTDNELKPTPSKWGCRFCDYAESCNYAIKEEDL